MKFFEWLHFSTCFNICLKLAHAQMVVVVFVPLSQVPLEWGLGPVFLSSDSLICICFRRTGDKFTLTCDFTANVLFLLICFASGDFLLGFATLEQMILCLFFRNVMNFITPATSCTFFLLSYLLA